MTWIFYALVAIPFASCYSLAQKWALNLKISKLSFLFWNSLGTFLFFLVYNLIQGQFLPANPALFLLWGTLIAFFSAVGGLLSISAMEKTPNPGYIATITSINALLIIFATTIILGSSISFWPVIGALVVILGLFPLFSQKINGKQAKGWQLPAVLAMLCYAAMATINRFLLADLGYTPAQTLMVLFFYSTIIYGIMRFKDEPQKTASQMILVLLALFLALLGSVLGNLLAFYSDKIAPNAGYGRAIFNINAVLTLILSVFIFHKEKGGEFNLARWLGVVLVIGGLILVILTATR